MIPYERTVEFQAISGQDNYIEIGVPIRGTLNKLIVNQVDGTAEGYSFDLYNQEAAAMVAAGSISSSDSADRQPNQHKILPTQTVAADSRAVEHFEKVWTYTNLDGTPSTRKGRLYLRITPEGTGTKTFEVAFSIAGPQW